MKRLTVLLVNSKGFWW